MNLVSFAVDAITSNKPVSIKADFPVDLPSDKLYLQSLAMLYGNQDHVNLPVVASRCSRAEGPSREARGVYEDDQSEYRVLWSFFLKPGNTKTSQAVIANQSPPGNSLA